MKVFTDGMDYPVTLYSNDSGLFIDMEHSHETLALTPDINVVPEQLHGLYKRFVRAYSNVTVCLAKCNGQYGLSIGADAEFDKRGTAFSKLIIAGAKLEEAINALHIDGEVYLGFEWFPFGYPHDFFVFVPQSEDDECIQYVIGLVHLLMMNKKITKDLPLPHSRSELAKEPKFIDFLEKNDFFALREYECPDLSGLHLYRRTLPEGWVTNDSRCVALDIFFEAVSSRCEYKKGVPHGIKPRVFLHPQAGTKVYEVEPTMDQTDGTWYIDLPPAGERSLKRLYVTRWETPMMIFELNTFANHCGYFYNADKACDFESSVNNGYNCKHPEQGEGEEMSDGNFVGARTSWCPLGYTPDANDLAVWGIISREEAETYYDSQSDDYASMKDYVVVTDKETILRLMKNGVKPLNEKLYAD